MTKNDGMKKWSRVEGIEGEMGKIKVMVSGRYLHTLQSSGKYHCAVCRKGVGRNSIFCRESSFWVHKKCFNIPYRLVEDPELGLEGILVMHRQLMEDLALKSNLLMESLM